MTGLWAMAAGVLVRDPGRRTGSKGDFATATIRVGSGDAAHWINVIAFGDAAGRLLELRAGDSVAVSGRAELSEWRGRDGTERHGVRIVAAEVAAARPRPRVGATTRRRSASYLARQAANGDTTNTLPLNDPVSDLWPEAVP